MSDIETPTTEEDTVSDEILEITILEEDFEEPVAESAFDRPGRWYIVHTFAGHEQKVIGALHNIIKSRELEDQIYEIYLPEEDVTEFKSGKKVTVSKRMFPSYLLIRCEPDPEIFYVIGSTPGVTGFVGASNEPVPLTQAEVDRLLHQETAERPRSRAQFAIGESVKVISGPLSDFSGEISEVNEDAQRLKVLVSIFGRETPVEVGFDQVKKM